MMYEEYSCSVIQDMVSAGAQLVDLRSTLEFAQGALKYAKNIPMDSFEFLATSIVKEMPVLLYSSDGHNSEMVKYILEKNGYEQVHNIGPYKRYKDCMHDKLMLLPEED